MIANKVSSPTFRFLKTNQVEVELNDINPSSFGEIQKENMELNTAFSDYSFGVSEEAVKLNKDKKNLQYVFEVNHDEDLKNINIELNEEKNTLLDNIQIIARENTKSEFIINYTTKDLAKTFRNSVLQIYAKEDSEVTIHLVTNQNQESTIWQSICFIVENHAKVTIYQTEIGVGKKLFSCMGKLTGNGSIFDLKGSYLLSGQEKMDFLYNVDLYGKKSNANILVNGVQKDFSKKNFKGTLDFKRGSKGSKGSEGEYVTLLNKTVISKSLPILLCTEEDVVGEHASSAGQIDKNIIFYIMSRGLSFDEAKSLVVKSRLVPVIDALPDKHLRESLLEQINQIMIEK